MKKLVSILLFLSYSAVCQQVYQVHEVEKPAEPSGGIAQLNQFIAANLQIPIKSAAKGMNGRVFIKGIVEPDGSMTGLEIARSMDSVSDREALRVMNLYKAWKPAIIKDKIVRQVTTFPVTFRTAVMPDFDSTENAIQEYFDKNNILTTDKNKYKFRNMIPVDERGYVRSDILYQESRSGKWKTLRTIPFKKTEFWAKISGPTQMDSVKAFRVSARMDNWESSYEEVIFQEDGKLLSYSVYPGSGRPPSLGKFYYKNGMLHEEQIVLNEISKVTNWYDNGQIKSVRELGGGKGVVVKNSWDRDGTPNVKDGNGWAKIPGNSYEGKSVFEEGKVLNGSKTGRWTGKLADSTLLYEEFYENGKLTKGVSEFDGEKSDYGNDAATSPQFHGGPDKMYQFLGQNLKNPVNALQGNQGRVVVSFLVNEDGTLGDYKIENGIVESTNQEVLRVVKLMSGKWEPGTLKGQKIKARFNLVVNFQ